MAQQIVAKHGRYIPSSSPPFTERTLRWWARITALLLGGGYLFDQRVRRHYRSVAQPAGKRPSSRSHRKEHFSGSTTSWTRRVLRGKTFRISARRWRPTGEDTARVQLPQGEARAGRGEGIQAGARRDASAKLPLVGDGQTGLLIECLCRELGLCDDIRFVGKQSSWKTRCLSATCSSCHPNTKASA